MHRRIGPVAYASIIATLKNNQFSLMKVLGIGQWERQYESMDILRHMAQDPGTVSGLIGEHRQGRCCCCCSTPSDRACMNVGHGAL